MKPIKNLNYYILSNLVISTLSLNNIVNYDYSYFNIINNNLKTNNIQIIEVILNNTITNSISNSINNSISDNNIIQVETKEVQSKNTITYNYVEPSYNSTTGINLVNYAKSFLGLKYVYAGNSLTTGTDCSGYTMLIYKDFGISLGRTVSSQLNNGSYVSKNDLKPGDLVFYGNSSNYASHVAIYIGNNLVIHESTPKDGVKISSVNMMNYITSRRVIYANTISDFKYNNNNNNTNDNIDNDNNNITQEKDNELIENEKKDEIIEENNENDIIENQENLNEEINSSNTENSNKIEETNQE